MLKNHSSLLTDPKTKRTLLLQNHNSQKRRHQVYFDQTYIKYFIKEELEEMLKSHRGSIV